MQSATCAVQVVRLAIKLNGRLEEKKKVKEIKSKLHHCPERHFTLQVLLATHKKCKSEHWVY